MLHVSRLTPDRQRFAEFISCLWEGPVPDDLVLQRWIYVGDDPREMMLIWEGGPTAERWVDERFGSFGTLTTEPATEATPGLAACFDRDLAAFGEWMRARGSAEEQVTAELALREGGLEARGFDDAARAGRSWQAGRGA